MKHQTFKRIEKAWRSIPNDHRFDDRDHFVRVASDLGDVTGDGRTWFFTRIDEFQPYGPQNIALVHVVTEDHWDQVLYPAI